MMPPALRRITDYVGWYARSTPAAEAAVLGASRLTYAELEARVDQCAAALWAAGVRPGDRVAMLSTPHPQFFIVFLATASLGAIWLGLNPRYRRDELAYLLQDADPSIVFARTLIGEREYAPDLAVLRASAPERRWIALDDPAGELEPLATFLATGAGVDERVLADVRDTVDAAAPALLVYTSGSTGRPKGALLPHRGLVTCCRVQHRYWGTDPLRTLNFFPINHVGCVGDIACFTLVGGGCIVFLEQFEPAECLRLIARERVTLWGGVPTTFVLTLNHPSFAHADLTSVRKIVWSGAAASAELVAALARTGAWVGTSYGLTETIGSVTYTAASEPLDVLAETIGRPAPEFEIRLRTDAGAIPTRDQPGELEVRGDCLMTGYWRRPDETATAFTSDGWLRTGDLAYARADGAIVLAGRSTEAFKSGGYNVYPREVERVLEEIPGVRLTAVVAVPDPVFGQVGHAFVVAEGGALTVADLAAHCRAKLANYKVPKRIEIASDLPMLPIGKVDKRALAAQAAASAATQLHATVEHGREQLLQQ